MFHCQQEESLKQSQRGLQSPGNPGLTLQTMKTWSQFSKHNTPETGDGLYKIDEETPSLPLCCPSGLRLCSGAGPSPSGHPAPDPSTRFSLTWMVSPVPKWLPSLPPNETPARSLPACPHQLCQELREPRAPPDHPPQMPCVQPEAIGSTHSNEAEKTTAMKQVGELDEATITVSSVAVTQKVSLEEVGERIKWPARAREVFLQ